jgi:hypothetical protein
MFVLSCIAGIACSSSGDRRPSHSERDAARDADATDQPDSGELEDAQSGADAAGADAAAPPDCEAQAPLVCLNPSPHWGDVYPIFMRRCVSCHNGKGTEWPLNQYEHVADWYGEIRAQMLACTMPPVTAGIDMPLEERQTILSWIRCGFPK